MSKLRTIIVDDEPLALNLLRAHLNKLDTIEVLAECKNGLQAIKRTMDLQPDLLFLDIQMPGLNGFEVIKRLQSDVLPMVVFITAYDEYALKAFDVNAVDYLLKPIEASSIERAVNRCMSRKLSNDRAASAKPGIINAIDNIARQSDVNPASGEAAVNDQGSALTEDKIVIKDRRSITLLDQADIDWIDAAGDYMCIHANGDTHIMRSTMKNLQAKLSAEVFQRVHRSTIVNLSRIQKIIPHTKGEYFLQLGADERIKVSRNYRSVVKDLITEIDG
ncbi:MAG: LytTR family DNA-binding domain-containing protein [Arenicella sp.]|nr:LytTR family DNA-binding domain-containing protein [Arenicella sp.]